MKKLITLLTLAFVVTAGFSGCSKKTEMVETTQLEASFKSAEPATKSHVDKAVESIKNADYAGAIAQLQATLASGKLTAEQEQSIKGVMEQLQKLVVENLNKAVGDMQKSISK